MSTRKLPKPTYLHMPDGILDVRYRGKDFRIEGNLYPHYAHFTFKHCGDSFHPWDVLSEEEGRRYREAIVLWSYWRHQEGVEVPERWPDRAIFKVLDAYCTKLKAKVEAQHKEFDAKHPKMASSDVLRQLRARQAVEDAP